MNEDGLEKCKQCGEPIDPPYICYRCVKCDDLGQPADSPLHGIAAIASNIGISRMHLSRIITNPSSHFHLWQTPENPKYHTHPNSAAAGFRHYHEAHVAPVREKLKNNLIIWIKPESKK